MSRAACSARTRWIATTALLVVVMLCGAGVRSLRALGVFRGDAIVFPVGDTYYHMRRAEFSLEHPRQILLFDPLVNYPDGSWVPWPPLHTLLLVGTAELLGGTKHDLELAGAWYPVAIGAATALPVFGAATTLAGPGTALAAAALAVLFPAGVAYSDVGNADHHCTVSFFVALWLWGSLACLRAPPERRRRRVLAHALLLAGRVGVLLTWPGSILYLALADGGLVAIAIARGRSDVLRALALGLLATGLAVAWLVPQLGPPVGGPFSTLALSFLHAVAQGALAVVAATTAAIERRRPRRSVVSRLATAAAVALVAGAVLLALPGLLDTLREGLGFVGKEDPWAASNSEQRPLFLLGKPHGWLHPIWYFGGFAYAIPFLPVALWLAARRDRESDSMLVLALWSAGVGVLALLQIRYGADYSPVAGVGFAVALERLARRGTGWRTRGLVAGAALLGAGPFLIQHAAQLEDTRLAVRLPSPPGDPLLQTATGTLYRFAEEIRRVTPETDGYFDPTARPAYGILCPPNVGHVLHYVAHRATPSDNFGPYSGSRHFRRAEAFFELRSEERAVAVATALGARYVLTVEFGPAGYQGLTQRLHREDGTEREDLPHWEHFRLVTEGPQDGRPLTDLYGGSSLPGVAPYKLFELVEGAVLEIHAPPGEAVEASATLRTPIGRRFRFPIHRRAGDDGVVRIRVPYATDGAAPTGAIGPWRVQIGETVREVGVSEAAVREGRVIAVGGSS